MRLQIASFVIIGPLIIECQENLNLRTLRFLKLLKLLDWWNKYRNLNRDHSFVLLYGKYNLVLVIGILLKMIILCLWCLIKRQQLVLKIYWLASIMFYYIILKKFSKQYWDLLKNLINNMYENHLSASKSHVHSNCLWMDFY